ncbi:Uncharacterised protein r2_g664 [Pycnogonum litorale]
MQCKRTGIFASILYALSMLFLLYAILDFVNLRKAGPVKTEFHLEKYKRESKSAIFQNYLSFSQTPSCNTSTLVFVHSAPHHFTRRNSIRSSWGSIRNHKGIKIKTIFVIGQSRNIQVKVRVNEEAVRCDDVLLLGFEDSYSNLTIKHLSAYEWIVSKCRNVEIVIKSDDDIFINIRQLIDHVDSDFGNRSHKLLACSVFPVQPACRSGKWKLSQSEYPFDLYPSYCAGATYVATFDVVREFLNHSRRIPALWIDDIFVTGIVRTSVGILPRKLNVYYTADEKRLFSCNTANRCTWMVGLLSNNNIEQKMMMLWNRTSYGENFNNDYIGQCGASVKIEKV